MPSSSLCCLLFFFLASACCVEGFLYVGSEGDNLYTLDFDERTGKIGLNTTLTIVANPSFLALHPSGDYLYVVSEVASFNGIKTGGIASYRLNKATGHLTLLNKVASGGELPTHINVDRTGKWIGVANYDGGNYGVWEILQDFKIGAKPVSFVQDTGKGPMPQQEGPHAHEFVFNFANNFVVVPDLGIDRWMQFNFDAKTGQLTPFSQPSVESPPGSGPRHFLYHPTLPYAYGVCEITSSVTVFSADKSSPATLKPLQSITSIPPNQPQQSAAAEVKVSPEGNILYVSNRPPGVNGTIAIFRIDTNTGLLTYIGYTPTLGIYPRFFTLSNDGKFVLVANQNSDNIRVFKRDAATGLIGDLVGSVEHTVQASHILQI